MSKCYPVILYPPLIIKFLVKNPTPSLASYQLTKTPKQERRQIQSDSSHTASQFSLLSLSQWLGLFVIGIIMVSSFAFLSPSWLVVAIWGAIFLGFFCSLHLSGSKKYKLQNHQIPTTTDRTSRSVLRSPNREALLRQWLRGKVLQPTGDNSTAIQGISEKAFYQVLAQVFPSIVQGVEFPNTEFHHPYSADFVLVHESGLSIDIEVDEPYVGNTKAPHHCIDQGKDDIRNEFFTTHNWVVVRFSEKQVVQYPDSCCKVIAAVVARICGDYTYLAQLQSVPELPPDPMWTRKQAKKWAREDYRKTYSFNS